MADASSQFTLKSAYARVIQATTCFDSSRYVWWPTMPLGGRLFLWKLWMRSLPLADNLCAWQNIFPTQCVFCWLQSKSQDHIFLHCPVIQPVWKEISILFYGPMPSHTAIRGYLHRWWRSSSPHTILCQLRAVVPSLVVWVIWKEYTTIKFDDSSFSYRRLFESICDHVYTWSA